MSVTHSRRSVTLLKEINIIYEKNLIKGAVERGVTTPLRVTLVSANETTGFRHVTQPLRYKSQSPLTD